MTQTLDIEKILLENLRMLSTDKQQEVLDFVQFLVHKLQQTQDLSKESYEYSSSLTQPPPLKLFFTEIAKLPNLERRLWFNTVHLRQMPLTPLKKRWGQESRSKSPLIRGMRGGSRLRLKRNYSMVSGII